MYTLIGSAKTRALRPLWMLEELGLPYRHVATAAASAEARQLSPTGKLPVLVEDGESLTDSTAILSYLADKHGAFTAKPGTMARAQQDSVTQFLLDEFDALLWTAARHSFVLPEDQRLPAIKESLRWEYARSLARLSTRFKGPFLMGPEMTVPDIIATHCLNWGAAIKFGSPEGPLADYISRMRARPALLRAMAT
jgi:glutathione S-transferase